MVPNNSESAAARPLRSATIVLYTALGVLWLTIPQSVSNWTREALPAPVQSYATPAAETVEKVTRPTGLPALFEASRDFFLFVAKK